jgi:hypothetical protein
MKKLKASKWPEIQKIQQEIPLKKISMQREKKVSRKMRHCVSARGENNIIMQSEKQNYRIFAKNLTANIGR